MKTTLLLPMLLVALSGCALNDFVQKQQEWNARNGMGSMNAGVSIPSGHTDSAPPPTASTMPSFSEPPPSAMHCSGASSSATASNAGSFSSSTSCHN